MNSQPTSLIVAAINAGQLPEAERLCRAWLLQQPDDENLLLLLVLTLQQQKRVADALTVCRRLTALAPDSSLHWCNLASMLFAAGEYSEAEAGFTTSMRLDPQNAAPKIQAGLLYMRTRDYLRARDLLLEAFALDPNSSMVRIHAARACSLCQDFQGAESLLKPWREWLPLNDDALQLELARLLQLMSQVPAAEALLEEITSRNPAHMEARLALAKIYERKNDLAKAETALHAIASAGIAQSDVLANEVLHLRATLARRRGDVHAAMALLREFGPRYPGDYSHYFELARTCDLAADAAGAMEALHLAHQLQVDELKIASAEFFAPEAKAMPADVVRVPASAYANWPALIAPDANDSPVFIVGFPRSGTTLLEQMLDAHPRLQSMDENPFFNRLAEKLRRHDERILHNLEVLQQYDCDELRKQYLIMVSERINRRWEAQLVDKNPLNMLWMPLICRLFPRARFILALRHPCDVILSCYMQNFRSSMLAAACSSLPRLAEAYVQSMDYWLEDVSIFKPSVLVSRYEDLVADFPRQSRRIADFLELEDAGPMLGFDRRAREKGYIGTPSYNQVIEPVNRKGLDRWKKYRREFEPLLPVLAPLLQRWGYVEPVGL
jgi:Flp pilus assembly protein TadD